MKVVCSTDRRELMNKMLLPVVENNENEESKMRTELNDGLLSKTPVRVGGLVAEFSLTGKHQGDIIWYRYEFQGEEFILINLGGVWHVGMQRLAEVLGLEWHQQHRKIQTGVFRTFYKFVILFVKGEMRSVLLLPLRKYLAWFDSIKPEIDARKNMGEKLFNFRDAFFSHISSACPDGAITAEIMREWNRDNTLECSGLLLFIDVARGLKMSPLSLYQLLNKVGVLYQMRGKPKNSDEREHFGNATTYADFTEKDLFKRETVVHEHSDGTGSISSRLKVTADGVKFINALVKKRRQTANDIYRQIFPNEAK
jgi:phage antirepressor YoqD-like protein